MKQTPISGLAGTLSAAAAMTLLSGAGHAHTGAGAADGFAHGFMHPVGGLDHVLAMVLVGLLGASLGGRAIWALPAAFLAMMAGGGVLGLSGFALPMVEAGIAGSVIILGAALALKLNPGVLAAAAVCGFFAVFHGFAHGAEMPVDASGAAYGAGFLLATALLHAAGAAAGVAFSKLGGAPVARLAGAAASLAGIAIFTGAL
jgi:urease accessory protein